LYFIPFYHSYNNDIVLREDLLWPRHWITWHKMGQLMTWFWSILAQEPGKFWRIMNIYNCIITIYKLSSFRSSLWGTGTNIERFVVAKDASLVIQSLIILHVYKHRLSDRYLQVSKCHIYDTRVPIYHAPLLTLSQVVMSHEKSIYKTWSDIISRALQSLWEIVYLVD